MRLYLVRHGEALSESQDPSRPLSSEGRFDVERVALFLREAGVRVNHIYHSDKARAGQTAGILAGVLANEANVSEVTGLGPDDPIEPLLAHISQWKEGRMIVGHMPFMGRLCSALLGKAPVPVKISFPPACVVCLENYPEEHWAFRWMIEPRMLP